MINIPVGMTSLDTSVITIYKNSRTTVAFLVLALGIAHRYSTSSCILECITIHDDIAHQSLFVSKDNTVTGRDASPVIGSTGKVCLSHTYRSSSWRHTRLAPA